MTIASEAVRTETVTTPAVKWTLVHAAPGALVFAAPGVAPSHPLARRARTEGSWVPSGSVVVPGAATGEPAGAHYAKFIGRVGLLAAALGVGAALVGRPGVALAEPTDTDTGASSTSTSESGTDTQTTPSTPSTSDSTTESSGTEDTVSTSDGAETSRRAEEAEEAAEETPADTATPAEQAPESEAPEASEVSEPDVEQPAAETEVAETVPAPVVEETPAPAEVPAAPADTASADTAAAAPAEGAAAPGRNDSPTAPPAVTAPTTSETRTPSMLQVGPTVEESTPAVAPTLAEAGDQQSPTATPATTSATDGVLPEEPSTAAPDAPLAGVSQILSTVLEPLATPATQAAQTSLLWGVLAWLQRTFFNQTPTLTYNSTGTTQVDDTITGRVTSTDTDSAPLTYTATTPTNGGTVVMHADGSFTYTASPALAEHGGTDTFKVTASDAGTDLHIHGLAGWINLLTFGLLGNPGHTATTTVTLYVAAVNAAPIVGDPAYHVGDPDGEGTLHGAVHVSDPDHDSLVYDIAGGPADGSVTLGADGTFTYTPTPAARHDAALENATPEQLTDTFSVTVDDTHGHTVTVPVSVDIDPTNTAPTMTLVVSDPETDGTVHVSVLTTDTDGDPVTYLVVHDPASGTLTPTPGGFTYTPTEAARHAAAATPGIDTDTFEVRASDAHHGTDTDTATVVISPTNTAPIATADTVTTTEDTPVSGNVLTNDTDADHDTLNATLAAGPTHGNLTLHPNGSFTYTPAANYNGDDTFTYTASDAHGGTSNTATVSITVTAVNDTPVATGDTVTTTEDTPVSGNVLTNDTDVESTGLTAALSEFGPQHGTVNLNPDGSFTYTPNPDYNGEDQFAYQAFDADGALSNLATVTITITPVNDAPVINTVTSTPGTGNTWTIAVSATDPDADPVSVTLTPTDPAHVSVSGTTVTVTDTAWAKANPGAQISVIATADDGQGGMVATTVLIGTVNNATAVGGNYLGQTNIPALPAGVTYTQVAAARNHTVLLRSDGTVVAVGYNGAGQLDIPVLPAGVTYTQVAAGTYHTVLLRSDGTVVAVGSDGVGQLDIPSNNPGTYTQVAAGDTHTVLLRSDGTAVAVGNNSYGQAAIPVLPAGVTYTQVAAGSFHTVLLRSDGQVVAIGNGGSGQLVIPALPVGVTYTQVAAGDTHTVLLRSDGTAVGIGNNSSGQLNFLALPDGVTYTQVVAGRFHTVLLRSDGAAVAVGANGNGQINIPTLPTGVVYTDIAASDYHTVLLSAVNTAPAAGDDAVSTSENTPLVISPNQLLANDSDPDGDPLTVTAVWGASHGTTALGTDGTITYTPHADYTGTDTFQYLASDGNLGDAATVTVTINPASNAAPVASAVIGSRDSVTGAVKVTLTASDPDGDPVTVSNTPAAQGNINVVENADGTWTYTYTPTDAARLRATMTPEAETDSFTITVTDGNGGTATVEVPDIEISPGKPVVAEVISVGAPPGGVAVSRDGAHVYVTEESLGGRLWVIDTATGTATPTVSFSPEHGLTAVALNEDSSRAYIVARTSSGGDSFAMVMDTGANTLVGTPISVNNGANAIAVSPNGQRLYITHNPVGSANSISVIDTTTNTVIATLPATHPTAVTVNAAGTYAYVADTNSAGQGFVHVIDTATNTAIRYLPVSIDSGATAVTVSTDNSRLYVATADGHVMVLNATDGQQIRAITVGHSPTATALSTDGQLLYVTNQTDNTVTIIDTTTNTVTNFGNPVAVGNKPTHITVAPNGTAYTTNHNDGTLSAVDIVHWTNEAPQPGNPAFTIDDVHGATGVVDGSLKITDPDRDTLSYSLTTAPTQGAVTIDQATGAWHYTPTQEARVLAGQTAGDQFDAFTVAVSDGFNSPVAITVDHVPVSPTEFIVDAVISVGVSPGGVAVSRDGAHVYVTDESPGGRLWVIDTATGTATPTVSFSPEHGLAAVALNEDGSRAYIVARMPDGQNSFVMVMNTTTNTVVGQPIPVNNGADQIAVNTAGTRVYLTHQSTGNPSYISVIDTTTNTAIATLAATHPSAVTVNAAGTYAYVADTNSAGQGFVHVIDTATNTAIRYLPVSIDSGATAVTVSTDNSRLYVATADGHVMVLNATDGQQIRAITVGHSPTATALSTDGQLLYVTNQTDNTVTIIDTTTNTVTNFGNPVAVGNKPTHITVAPNGTAYTTNHNDGTLSAVVRVAAADITVNAPDYYSGVVSGTIRVDDPDGYALTYGGSTTTTKGTLDVSADGTFTYTPTGAAQHAASADNATQSDKSDVVVITADNGHGRVSTVYVSLPIAARNEEPIVKLVVSEPDPTTGQVSGGLNGSDLDGDTLTYTVTGQPAMGTVTVAPNGNFVYTPTDEARHDASAELARVDQGAHLLRAVNYADAVPVAAQDTFVVTVTDAHGGVTHVVVAVAVEPVNTEPTGAITDMTTDVTTGTITGTITASDADGDDLTYTVTGLPLGKVTVEGDGTFTYVPTDAARLRCGLSSDPIIDGFTISISDGHGGAMPVSVSGIDVAAAHFDAGTVDVGLAPVRMVLNADGSSGYLIWGERNTVKVLDTSTGEVTGTIKLVYSPTGVAQNADRTRAYFIAYDAGQIYAVDTDPTSSTYNTVTDTLDVDGPYAMAISPDGTHAYITQLEYNTVAVVDTGTGTVIDTIGVGGRPTSVAFNRDGTRAYVTNQTHGTVSVIDTITGRVIHTVNVDDNPCSVAVSPDGTHAYVINQDSNTVTVIDTATYAKTSVRVGISPQQVTLSPDGSLAYVVNLGDYWGHPKGSLSVIDTATNTVLTTIPTGAQSAGMALTTDGTRSYVVNSSDGTITVVSLVTGSTESTDPVATTTISAPDPTTGVVTVNLTANGRDGGPVDVTQNAPFKGELSVVDNGDGTWTYTYTPTDEARHAASADAATPSETEDWFIVTVTDDHGGTTTLQVGLAVGPANTAPDATISVDSRNPDTGAVTGRITALDPDDDSVTYTVTAASQGKVTVDPNGTFTYTPTDAARIRAGLTTQPSTGSFTVTVNDGHGGATDVTVSEVPIPAAELVKIGPVTGVGGRTVGMAATPDGTRIYVADHDTLSVIDTDLTSPTYNQIVGTVDIDAPLALAITPDGTRAYVMDGNGSIAVVDTDPTSATYNQVIGDVDGIVDGSYKAGVSISSDGTRAYVTHVCPDPLYDFGWVIDIDPASRTYNSVVEPLPFGPPLTPAITPDGSRVYFGGWATAVAMVDTSQPWNFTVVVFTDDVVSGLAITPDGSRAYATLQRTDAVVAIDTDPSSPTYNQVVTAPIVIGNQRTGYGNYAIAISPDGSLVYVVDSSSSDPAGGNALTVIDTETNTVLVDRITLDGTGNGTVTVTPDGSHIYVGGWTTGISVIALQRVI